jgi:hypothetical protein
MKIEIPKASRGYVFPRLFAVEMNDFDVERLLPSLFHTIVTRGRQRGRANDPKAFDRYIDALANHPRLEGFSDESGKRLLERWLRAAVVRMGRVGRAKKDEQIQFVLPLTLLSYKTGFPAEIRRQRNVHLFLYDAMLDLLRRANERPSPEAAISGLFTQAFGEGLHLGGAPTYDGTYDGTSALDVQALLCICFLDGFEAVPASHRVLASPFGPALPKIARRLAGDLLLYIVAYRGLLPVEALTRGLLALTNFGLFIYTMKLVYATNALVQQGTLPPVMTEKDGATPPMLYVDFTGERGGVSDNLARVCVERDLEELRAFFENVLLLRTLDRFVDYQPRLTERFRSLDTPAYLEALVSIRGEPEIEARAQAELESIEHDTFEAAGGSTEQEDVRTFLADIRRRYARRSLDAVVSLLASAQAKHAVEAYVRWFWGVGGLYKSFGLLSGNLRGKRNWRYAMSNDLLAALVHLAMIEGDLGTPIIRRTIQPRLRLCEFLAFLYERFGVVVDRPPGLAVTAEATAAAKRNLEGIKLRLRQMGFFEVLSDDFTAQYLRMQLKQKVSG